MNIITPQILPPRKNISFCGKSKEFRAKYHERIANNQLSKTSIANLNGLANAFSNEGLTYNELLKAAKRNPFILFQKPETMEYNIREVAKRFKEYGLTDEKYLHYALKDALLFSYSPDRIQKNINGTVKLFESYGLTTEKYLQNAISQPSLFYYKPQVIKKKIYKIADTLNISTFDILAMMMKQPSLFVCKEKEIIKKYEILKYIEENKFFDANLPIPSERELSLSVLRKKFSSSIENCFLQMLRNKVSNGLNKSKKPSLLALKKSMSDFIIENKTKKIEFKIKDGKYAKDFKRFSSQFSKNLIGKNIFRINIVKY